MAKQPSKPPLYKAASKAKLIGTVEAADADEANAEAPRRPADRSTARMKSIAASPVYLCRPGTYIMSKIDIRLHFRKIAKVLEARAAVAAGSGHPVITG